MPIYTFKCPCGHIFDKIVPMVTKTAPCERCERKARRTGLEVPAKRNPQHGIQTQM